MSATHELLFSAEQVPGHNEPTGEESMRLVSDDVYFAGHAHDYVRRAGGRRSVPVRETLAEGACPLRGQRIGEITEFVTPTGEVLSRKVIACGERLCWLRRDIAEAAAAAIDAEAAEHKRIAAVVCEEMDRRDSALAAERGETLEHFRIQRNHRGMKFDRYRHAAGRG